MRAHPKSNIFPGLCKLNLRTGQWIDPWGIVPTVTLKRPQVLRQIFTRQNVRVINRYGRILRYITRTTGAAAPKSRYLCLPARRYPRIMLLIRVQQMAESALPFADEDYDVYPPPRDDGGPVAIVLWAFEQAARGEFVAWSLERALTLPRSVPPDIAVDEEQRDELLIAIARARVSAEQSFDVSYDRTKIGAGMDAAAARVALLAESAAQRAAREALCAGYEADVCDLVSLFRLDLSGMIISDRFMERAQRREDARRKLVSPWAKSDEAGARCKS